MNETIVYNVWHAEAYGFWILAYFFLAGMGGGSFIVSALAKIFGKEKYKAVTDVGAVCAPVMVALGGFFLVFDLARPERVFTMLFRFNPTSPVSWGGMFIGLFMVISMIYLYYLFIAKDDAKVELFARIGIVVAIALTSYTAFLISMAKARPLWHSAVMPPLFLISSCISGLALVLLVVNILKKYPAGSDVLHRLGRILIILIIIDIFFLNDMYVLYIGMGEAREVALLLLIGKFAFLFWVIEVLIGSLAPIAILYSKKLAPFRAMQIVAAILSLVGVFTMRYIIVIIGQYLPIS